MTRMRWVALTWIMSSIVLSALLGFSLMRSSPNLMVDFKGVFYNTRCLLQHTDPYKPGEPLRAYLAVVGNRTTPTEMIRCVLTLGVYPPATFIFIAPFAILPWGTAQVLWTIVGIGSLSLAAFLMWDSGASYAPVISCGLICFVLANTEFLFFGTGNPAAIAISLCVVAVWCFLKNRFVWAGVLCLAVSLAIKPHDAGLVWLCFLLAGGIYRKRALQTLLVTAVLGLASILWVTPIAPHWIQELHSNLVGAMAPGGENDPGPAGGSCSGPGMIISLQSAVSVFRDNPRIYNSVNYLICGALLLAWAIRTLRSRLSQKSAWFALAAVVPLSIVMTYHRTGDAKLLLLAVPACAMLWTEGGPIRWLALLVTSAGITFTADIPLTIHLILTKNLHISTAGLSGQIETVVLMRPVPLVLLLMSIFYLWIYLRREPEEGQP